MNNEWENQQDNSSFEDDVTLLVTTESGRELLSKEQIEVIKSIVDEDRESIEDGKNYAVFEASFFDEVEDLRLLALTLLKHDAIVVKKAAGINPDNYDIEILFTMLDQNKKIIILHDEKELLKKWLQKNPDGTGLLFTEEIYG